MSLFWGLQGGESQAACDRGFGQVAAFAGEAAALPHDSLLAPVCWWEGELRAGKRRSQHRRTPCGQVSPPAPARCEQEARVGALRCEQEGRRLVKGIRRGGSKIKNKKLTNGFNVSMVKEEKTRQETGSWGPSVR